MSQRASLHRRRSVRSTIAFLILGGITLWPLSRAAADLDPVPRLVPYSGTLDLDGQPSSGTAELVFEIYDAPQGGSVIWGPETHDAVPVQAGRFSVVLGSVAPLTDEVFAGSALYLAVKVNGVTLTGRQRLLAVPYSVRDAGGPPPGSVMAFAGDSPPPGWLLCDGRSLLRADYPLLFQAIGCAWSCENADSFNIPDLRGRFLRGVDGGAGRDPDVTERYPNGNGSRDAVGSTQPSELASHSHDVADPGHDHHVSQTGKCNCDNVAGGDFVDSVSFPGEHRTGFNTTGITIKKTGGNETRPANVYINYIIRY